MQKLPLLLGVTVTLGLAACVTTQAPPPETCTDPSGAVYAKPAGGCPAYVPVKVRKPAIPAKPKVAPKPVVEEKSGGDGGSDSGGGWGG